MKQSKRMKVILSICLVAVLAIGGTWAYLSTQTQKLTNVFTFQENITADLTEPGWTGGTDENDNGIPDAAENMVPGSEVSKDPQITNTSNIDEYVAIKLTFQDGSGNTLSQADMTKLMGLITIQSGTTSTYNVADWTLAVTSEAGKSEQTWYYNTLLTHTTNNLTSAIFDSILINEDISSADFAWLNGTYGEVKAEDGTVTTQGTGLGGFQIHIEGAAVQADVFADVAEAASDSAGLWALLNPTPVTP